MVHDSQSVSFDRASSFYDATRGFPPGEDRQIGSMISQLGNLNQISQVLEIGVGTGRIASPLAQHVQQMVGIDISTEMMSVLRQKQGKNPVHLIQGDATQLPLPDNSVDAVVTVHVFHLIPRWEYVLEQIARVLRPNALLLNGYNGHHLLDDIRKEAFEGFEAPAMGVAWNKLDSFLVDKGWRYQSTETHTYPVQVVPINMIDAVQQRMWSRTWFMGDTEIEMVSERIQALITKHFSDLGQPITLEGSFTIESFLPPLT